METSWSTGITGAGVSTAPNKLLNVISDSPEMFRAEGVSTGVLDGRVGGRVAVQSMTSEGPARSTL